MPGPLSSFASLIPFYDETVFHKTAEMTLGYAEDTAADNRDRVHDRAPLRASTAALTELRFSSGSGNLASGSRLSDVRCVRCPSPAPPGSREMT